jgi:hypothetical protein
MARIKDGRIWPQPLASNLKGIYLMDPTVTLVEYIGFVVAALIIVWAAIEFGKRIYARKNVDAGSPRTWARMNSIRHSNVEESLPDADDDDDEGPESDIDTRAKQNGHYSESKKPL